MKKSLNQHVTLTKRNKIGTLLNKSTQNDTLDYSWCFETTLDLMSEVENEFQQIWVLLTSASY